MAESLLKTFSNLEDNLKHRVSDLASPLLLCFTALSIASTRCRVDRLTAEHIVACLEAAGTALSKKSVLRALARAGNRITVQPDLDGEPSYKLMIKGQQEVSKYLEEGSIEVVRVDGTKPRTDRIRLAQVLAKMNGVVRICDPFYGHRTLDSLDQLPKKCKVRFLTQRTSEGGRKLESAMTDFGRERPGVEFRINTTKPDLHDRFIITEAQLIIVGHGLKDLGSKESFMISLDHSVAVNVLTDLRASFDKRWQNATLL